MNRTIQFSDGSNDYEVDVYHREGCSGIRIRVMENGEIARSLGVHFDSKDAAEDAATAIVDGRDVEWGGKPVIFAPPQTTIEPLPSEPNNGGGE